MSKYLVGFDRFIALEWANFAMELSSTSESKSVKISHLKDWLSLKVSGKDATRKTANVLTRLWLEPNIDVEHFRGEAQRLTLDTRKSDYIFFHWGIALLVFPFFRETCIQIGRLSALQTTINRREIHARISEKYSNQSTIPRSVDRIFQTLLDWNILIKIKQQEYTLVLHQSANANVKRWLLELITFSASNKRIPVNNFYRLPELFPFEINGEVRQLIHQSSHVKMERDGSDTEYIVWPIVAP
jgi:hypothetical protein